jgi:hypothetical protein
MTDCLDLAVQHNVTLPLESGMTDCLDLAVQHNVTLPLERGAGQKSQEGDESGYFFGLDSV